METPGFQRVFSRVFMRPAFFLKFSTYTLSGKLVIYHEKITYLLNALPRIRSFSTGQIISINKLEDMSVHFAVLCENFSNLLHLLSVNLQ